jgi:hypothetical protein
VICIGVVLFGVVVMLHLFAVLYSFSPFVCFILMVEFYNIFADFKKKNTNSKGFRGRLSRI